MIRKNIPFIHSQTISDQRGRYVIVSGTLNSTPLILVNVYGPNFDDAFFFQNLCKALPNLSDSSVIMGGDFNNVLDPILDRQHSKSSTCRNSGTLNNLMQSYNLVDIWRLLHPTTKDFSYFSTVHKSYSRIDFFLLDSKLLHSVIDCTYHNILISDHAPVSLSLDLNQNRGEHSWHLNNALLKDEEFCTYLSDKIEIYLNTNDVGDVDDSTLWEAMKAVLRGHIISYEIAEKKKSKQRLTEIDDQLTKLEASYKTERKIEVLNKITALRYEYNSMMSKNILKLLDRVRQRYFELGDKPHRLLARQLRQMQASKAIHCIKSERGTLHTDPVKINECFADFYANVYRSQGNLDLQAFDNFFENLNLPKLSLDSADMLDKDITLEEITQVISSFPNNKAPGPDGFNVEFFKKIWP